MHLVFELIASMNEEESDKTTITNSSWTKASLRWRGSIKTGSIGLRSKKVSSANKYLMAGRLSIWDLATILSSKQIIMNSLKKRPVTDTLRKQPNCTNNGTG